MADTSEYTITGVVTKVLNYTTPGLFDVQVADGQNFRCTCPFYKPVQVGDCLSGVVRQNAAQLMKFEAEPFVQIPNDEYNVKLALIRAFKGAKQSTGDTLYDCFVHGCEVQRLVQMTPKLGQPVQPVINTPITAADVDLYLGTNAEDFMLRRNAMAVKTVMAGTALSTPQTEHLLKWWYSNRQLRKLYLLGLTMEEIRKCYRPLNTIYTWCTGIQPDGTLTAANPHRLPSLSAEKCSSIMRMLGMTSAAADIACGQIVRKMFAHTEMGWTYSPVWMLQRDHPSLTEHRERLIDEYEVKFEGSVAYLPYPYLVETTVANYCDTLIKRTAATQRPVAGPNVQVRKCSTLDPEQEAAITGALESEIAIITGGPGTGKCLSPETEVIRATGERVQVQHLEVGDRLMGDNGEPRTVQSMGRGQDIMYRIRPDGAQPFICNRPHILTLRVPNPSPHLYRYRTLDISLERYLQLPKHFQEQSLLFRAAVAYPEVALSADPYAAGLDIRLLTDIGQYHYNSIAIRQQFLAGVLDAIGVLDRDRLCLLDAPAELNLIFASLGYLTYFQDRSITVPATILNELPVQKLMPPPWLECQPTSIGCHFEVEQLGIGPYCGFTLDGNGRFLLGDYLVTHNTVVSTEIVNNLETRQIPYMIGSYTGKAVSRIHEVLGRKSARTLDRMIMQAGTIPPFQHLIIDEISMVTTELLYRFILAFPHRFRLTLIGDRDQLQPIAWGSLFSELLNARRVPTFRLNRNHRMAEASDQVVLDNAHRLISRPDLTQPVTFREAPGFAVLEGGLEVVNSLVMQLAAAGVSKEAIAVLSPFNEYLPAINGIFERVFLANAKHMMDSNDVMWYVGCRVMMQVNNYVINVMNGEEGEIVDVTDEGIVCMFRDGEKHLFKYVPRGMRKQRLADTDEDTGLQLTTESLTKSFGITVHKAQGSEQDYVIFYIPYRSSVHGICKFLNLNLLYTGITRTKVAIWLVGSTTAMVQASCRVQSRRCDRLSVRLREMINSELEAELIAAQAARDAVQGGFLPEDDDDMNFDDSGECYLTTTYFDTV
jgi:hypothetical protein